MNTGDIFHEFYLFLLDHEALERYLTNIQSDLTDFRDYSIASLISDAFYYADDYYYWVNLSDLWNDRYDEDTDFGCTFTCQQIYDYLKSQTELTIKQPYEYW